MPVATPHLKKCKVLLFGGLINTLYSRDKPSRSLTQGGQWYAWTTEILIYVVNLNLLLKKIYLCTSIIGKQQPSGCHVEPSKSCIEGSACHKRTFPLRLSGLY